MNILDVQNAIAVREILIGLGVQDDVEDMGKAIESFVGQGDFTYIDIINRLQVETKIQNELKDAVLAYIANEDDRDSANAKLYQAFCLTSDKMVRMFAISYIIGMLECNHTDIAAKTIYKFIDYAASLTNDERSANIIKLNSDPYWYARKEAEK